MIIPIIIIDKQFRLSICRCERVITTAAAVPARGDAGAAPAVIEVVLRNGRLLRVPESVAPARAVTLADALEGFGR